MTGEEDQVPALTAGDNLLKIVQVAEILSISTRQVWRLIAAKVLPEPVKIGHSARLYTSEIAAYLQKLREQRHGG